jgi:phosphate transport system substrate-binding protein
MLGVGAFLTACALAACGGGDDDTSGTGETGDEGGGSVSGEVIIDGSSTVGPIAEAAAEEFGKVSDVNVVVGISGTGGGFEKFCRGETDISNASRPIKREEFQLCTDNGVETTELSVAFDGLTVAINPENTWATCLTFTQLKSIFDEGATVTNWNQIDPAFPDEPLTIFSPGADSGTFDYFTEEVNGVLDRARSDGSVTFSEDDNVLVQGIQSARGAIGYFGYAYYLANQEQLKALELNRDISKDGQPLPTGTSRGCVGPSEPTVLNLSYPLSRPLYMYASNKSLKDKPQVGAYLEFVLKSPQLISDVGYIKLEDGIYAQNLAKLAAAQ